VYLLLAENNTTCRACAATSILMVTMPPETPPPHLDTEFMNPAYNMVYLVKTIQSSCLSSP